MRTRNEQRLQVDDAGSAGNLVSRIPYPSPRRLLVFTWVRSLKNAVEVSRDYTRPLEGTLNENVDVKYYILYYNSKITVHVGFLMYGHDQSVVHTVDA